MDFTPFLKSFEEHTKALFVHAAAIEKLITHAGSTQDTAAAPKGPGRPRKVTDAPADSSAPIAPVTSAIGTTVMTSAPVSQPATAAATAATGKPLTHLDLKDSFLAFAKVKGRDAIVALLGEFGASEFGKVKNDDLPLFKARLEGQPQTPVATNDATNLLGL